MRAASTNGTRAVHFQVDPSLVALAEQGVDDAAAAAGAVAQRVVGHLLEEARIVFGTWQDLRAQCMGQGRVAEKRPEVEKDARVQQRLRVAPVDPAGEKLVPVSLVEAERADCSP